ncbi:MAG: hypothetical protein Fur005_35080 [Roseiflexaceae bacterium]
MSARSASANPVVGLLTTSPATILADYQRLMLLVGSPQAVPTRVVVSVGQPLPFPGCSTPPWQLEAVLRACGDVGCTDLLIALSQPDPEDWHGYRAAAAPTSGRFPRHPLAMPAAEQIIALVPLSRGPILLPETSDLVLIDATMVGNGPPNRASHPEIGNLILATRSAALAEEVIAALLGERPFPEQVQLVGDTAAAHMRWLPHTHPPLPPTSWFNRLFGTLRPQVTEWSAAERERYTSWLADTAWGRLFRQYHQRHQPPEAMQQVGRS